jgi:O-antigen/teichoic acid export membrane protein
MSIISRHPSLTLAASLLSVEGAVFMRNLILARLIGPDEMGLAVALVLGFRLVEMIGDFGHERLLVQVRESELPLMRGATHFIQATKGVLLFLVVVLLAVPLATLFGPGLSPAIFVLAATSLILRGFANCEYRERQRNRDYAPTLVVEGGSNALALAAIAPIAMIAPDYTAIAWASVLQAASLCLLSHAMAHRTIRFNTDRQAIRKVLRFGLPVACNGALLFLAMQGDRLVVALHVSPADLARFAIAAQLALLPTLAGSRFLLSYDLPVFSKLVHSRGDIDGRYRRRLTLVGTGAATLATCLALLGTDFVALLYGEAFACTPAVMALLAVGCALRLLRAVPTTVLIAHERTSTAMLCNLPRVVSLPLAFAMLSNGGGIASVVCIGALSEAVGLALGLRAVHGLRSAQPIPALNGATSLS